MATAKKSIAELLKEALQGKTPQEKSQIIDQLLKEKELYEALKSMGLTLTPTEATERARLKPEGIMNLIEKVNLIDLITEITTIKTLQTLDLVNAITNIANIQSLDLIDQITNIANIQSLDLIDQITNIANIANLASVDLIDNITNVGTLNLLNTVSLIKSITSVDLVSAITNIANIQSLDLIDKLTEILKTTLERDWAVKNNFFSQFYVMTLIAGGDTALVLSYQIPADREYYISDFLTFSEEKAHWSLQRNTTPRLDVGAQAYADTPITFSEPKKFVSGEFLNVYCTNKSSNNAYFYLTMHVWIVTL